MSTEASHNETMRPWYREPWLWFVIALPFSAVVAGISTVIVANSGSDSLVVDDFEKVGLVARRETGREREAVARHVAANISIDRDSGQVILRLEGDARPAAVTLNVFHPTRRDMDRSTLLIRDDAGLYRGNIGENVTGHWYVQLADDAGEWRVTGKLPVDANLVSIKAE